MKVLHVVNSFDPAGDVTRSVGLLQKHSQHEHKLIVKDRHPLQDLFQFEEPFAIGKHAEAVAGYLLNDWCDVTIYHFVGANRGWNEPIKPAAFRNSNIFYDLKTQKFFCWEIFSANDLERYKLLASSHLAAEEFLPGCQFLPSLIPIHDQKYTPDWRDRKPCFSFIKHHEWLKNVDNAKLGMNKQDLWGKPHHKVMGYRALFASLALDNYDEGHYGLAGLESLALGIPSLAWSHPRTMLQLDSLAPGQPSPFIELSGPSIRAVIDTVKDLSSAAHCAIPRQAARNWIEQYYNPQRLVDQYWDPFVDKLGEGR